MSIYDEALEFHKKIKGKLEVVSRAKVNNEEDLSLAYTPGVAKPCQEIAKDKENAYLYTRKWNTVAVISDGTAVLGLGDIGAEASLPVMEGKAILFKEFADVDAFPIVLDTKEVDEIVETIVRIAPSFGAINLEDISAPRCFEIENRLKEKLDIPVFHDDQHGTAIVTLAAIINALRIVNKQIDKLRVVVNGAGAAGSAITKLLINTGVKDIVVCNRKGSICRGGVYKNKAEQNLAEITNPRCINEELKEVIKQADVFIGVSAPNVVTKDMIASMNKDAIVFAMANPEPEIYPSLAKEAGAKIVGTGRSDFSNQINNVLAFPGIFRGALDARAKEINEDMKVAAAQAIAGCIKDEELSEDYIVPRAFDLKVQEAVADAVKQAAIKSGIIR
ncbi:NAD-dependent malic enzyme [Clostridiaceae bacterium M8S5]|nr:NAD-dependent malic enzyme [Clostridiaceae bacterium M8S5]